MCKKEGEYIGRYYIRGAQEPGAIRKPVVTGNTLGEVIPGLYNFRRDPHYLGKSQLGHYNGPVVISPRKTG